MENKKDIKEGLFYKCPDYSEKFFYLSEIIVKAEIILFLVFIYFFSNKESKFVLLILVFIIAVSILRNIRRFLNVFRNPPSIIKFNEQYIYQENKNLSLENIKFVKEIFIPESNEYGLYFKLRYYFFTKSKIGRIIGYTLLVWILIILAILYFKSQLTIKEISIIVSVIFLFTIIHAVIARLFFAFLFKFNIKEVLFGFKHVLLDDGNNIMFIFVKEDCFQQLKKYIGGKLS